MLSCTRRELIASFLGLPLLAACDKLGSLTSRQQRAFEGGFAGPDHALGHKLREGLAPAPSHTRQVPVLVLGAGIAGLSAAWRLLRAGQTDFEVLELERVAGGTSCAGRNAISAFPWGAHYLPSPLPHARAARAQLVDLGVASQAADGELSYDESQWVRAPQERLFVLDRWYEGLFPFAGASERDVAELTRFEKHVAELSRLQDDAGKRLFALPLAAAGDPGPLAALDSLTFSDWLLREGYTSKRLRFFLEYGTRDDMCARLDQTSAFAGLHYHAARSDAHGPSNFLTWPDGNGQLVARLAARCGSLLRTSVLVTRIAALPDARWEVHTFEPATGRSEALQAQHVIAALPDGVLSRLLPAALNRPSLHAQGLETGAWLVANVSLRKRPQSRGYPECWDNVLYGSQSLGYVVATHQTDSAERARSVWTWYLPLTGTPHEERKRLAALSFQECCALLLADLSRPHPDIAEHIERIDFFRWAHAMPRPAPGMFFGPLASARKRASASLPGLSFAHTELSGLALFEEAQWHGVRAAEEVLAARGVLGEQLA